MRIAGSKAEWRPLAGALSRRPEGRALVIYPHGLAALPRGWNWAQNLPTDLQPRPSACPWESRFEALWPKVFGPPFCGHHFAAAGLKSNTAEGRPSRVPASLCTLQAVSRLPLGRLAAPSTLGGASSPAAAAQELGGRALGRTQTSAQLALSAHFLERAGQLLETAQNKAPQFQSLAFHSLSLATRPPRALRRAPSACALSSRLPAHEHNRRPSTVSRRPSTARPVFVHGNHVPLA